MCIRDRAYTWSKGKAIYAAGVQFAPVHLNGQTFLPGQANNFYIFPAVGMAIFATQAKRVTDEMFIEAGQAVADVYKRQAKYKDAGLIVIGVHTPEFSFEKEPANVQDALRDLKVTYPVPIDSNYRIWQSFNNEYWPAQYLIDAKGQIRYHHFGEGDYGQIEHAIQELLKENGVTSLNDAELRVSAEGVEAAPSEDVQSPETYIGYRQAERFASPGRMAHDLSLIHI